MTIYASRVQKGFYDSDIHTTLPADAVEISQETHQALLAGQSSGLIINFNTESGIPELISQPTKSKEEWQAVIWERIKRKRDELIQKGGFHVGDKWFHSDTFSRSQHIGLVLMGSTMPAGIQWKTMDGSFIEMTPTLAAQIFAAAATQDMAIFAAAESHRAAMILSNDPKNYSFVAGWPSTYGAA